MAVSLVRPSIYTTHTFLLVLRNNNFAGAALGSSPQFSTSDYAAKLLVGHLKVMGNEEFFRWSTYSSPYVQDSTQLHADAYQQMSMKRNHNYHQPDWALQSHLAFLWELIMYS